MVRKAWRTVRIEGLDFLGAAAILFTSKI